MRIIITIFILFIFVSLPAQTDLRFDDYFGDKTMRIDYFHTGDSETDIISLDEIYVYGIWAGSTVNLIDKFNNGKYYVKVYDAQNEKLIFSKGFDSYFYEYQTSGKAKKGIKKTFAESVLIPLPKRKIKFVLLKRDEKNKLNKIFETIINPESVDIIREKPDSLLKIIEAEVNGNPHNKVDVVILSEGYSNNEYSKFEKDIKRFTETFFSQEPYKSLRNEFNIRGVFKSSQDSGVDEPRSGIFKSTNLNCTFNSLGSARYLLTRDNKAMRDMASAVPYDAIYIMVNHKRYGGGGIYNQFCTFTADNKWSEYVFLHEFGHSFAGLADEYYTSSVAYSDFYPEGVEPVEPNITALLNPPNVKWQKFVSPGIEIPTPWRKAEFDSLDLAWQKQRRKINSEIAKLKKENAPQEKIDSLMKKADRIKEAHTKRVEEFLKGSNYWGKVGAFEGAGYVSKGLYRPMLDCIMFSIGEKPFCKVCENAIISVINHYAE